MKELSYIFMSTIALLVLLEIGLMSFEPYQLKVESILLPADRSLPYHYQLNDGAYVGCLNVQPGDTVRLIHVYGGVTGKLYDVYPTNPYKCM